MSRTRHQKIFDILQKIAEANEPGCNNYRLSAALVYKNDIVSIGWNQNKTHPFQKRFAKNEHALDLHAENSAVKNALSNHNHPDFIRKCTLYVLRLRHTSHRDKNFLRGLAKPCCGCMRMISTFGIQKVFYTTEDGYDYL